MKTNVECGPIESLRLSNESLASISLGRDGVEKIVPYTEEDETAWFGVYTKNRHGDLSLWKKVNSAHVAVVTHAIY